MRLFETKFQYLNIIKTNNFRILFNKEKNLKSYKNWDYLNALRQFNPEMHKEVEDEIDENKY